MKARIYCMIQVPPGREFIGANDYIYNNIDSVAFNEGGRHGEGETWQKTMYGAFSGPLWVVVQNYNFIIKSCMCTTQSIYTVLCINIYYNYNYKYKLLDSKYNLVFYVFNVSYLLQFATCIDCLWWLPGQPLLTIRTYM